MIFDFGFRLCSLREQKRLTQAQVAARLNLSKASISGYENNVKTPSLGVLADLSMLYGVSTDYLLGLERRESLFIDELTQREQEIMKILLTEFKSMAHRR